MKLLRHFGSKLNRGPYYQIANQTNQFGLPREELNVDLSKISELQQMVKEQLQQPGPYLSDQVKAYSQTNEEFNQFLKDFRSDQETNWSSVVDLSNEADIESYKNSLNSLEDYQLNRLQLQEAYRKKKIISSAPSQMQEFDQSKLLSFLGSKAKQVIAPKDKNNQLEFQNCIDRRFFKMMYLKAWTTTNVTTLQRIFKRNVLLMCGNFDGIASYAVGKGDNFKLAYENAIKVLRKNFIAFPLDHNMPITKKIVVNHNGTYLKVWPSYEGHMYGSPLYCAMLQITGLNCFQFRQWGNNSIYNFTRALFKILASNETLRDESQRLGVKQYEMNNGRPTRLSRFEIPRNF